jgi:hypothetical protein
MAKTMNKFYKITQFGLVLGGHLILITIIVFLEFQNQGTIVSSLKSKNQCAFDFDYVKNIKRNNGYDGDCFIFSII